MATKNLLCLVYGKRLKLTHKLTRHINIYTSHQVLFIHIQLKQDILIQGKNENASKNVGSHEDEQLTLEEQDIEKDHRNLGGKSSDTRNHARDGLSGCTLQSELLENELSSSLREVRFNDQEFATSILISNIKYNHPRFQNDNLFYPFYDQLNYRLAKYFAESKITKSNIDKFLSEPLMTLLTKKLSYQNADK